MLRCKSLLLYPAIVSAIAFGRPWPLTTQTARIGEKPMPPLSTMRQAKKPAMQPNSSTGGPEEAPGQPAQRRRDVAFASGVAEIHRDRGPAWREASRSHACCHPAAETRGLNPIS